MVQFLVHSPRPSSFGPGLAAPIGAVSVPTLYVWGDEDPSVGRIAAEGTAAHVTGPFRFVELAGVGHFASDEQPDQVASLLLEHLSAPHRPSGM